MTYEIRTALPLPAIANALRREVAAVDASLPLVDLRTMDQQVAESISSERLLAALVSAFGVIVALIAAIGLYGVMAYTVARRTSEMGIRLALGASRMGGRMAGAAREPADGCRRFRCRCTRRTRSDGISPKVAVWGCAE